MSKSKDTKRKNDKTAPATTPKEKKAAKSLKKDNKNNTARLTP